MLLPILCGQGEIRAQGFLAYTISHAHHTHTKHMYFKHLACVWTCTSLCSIIRKLTRTRIRRERRHVVFVRLSSVNNSLCVWLQHISRHAVCSFSVTPYHTIIIIVRIPNLLKLQISLQVKRFKYITNKWIYRFQTPVESDIVLSRSFYPVLSRA